MLACMNLRELASEGALRGREYLFWVELDWIPLAVLFLPEEEALLSASIVFRGCCLVLKTWCGDHWHTKSYNSLVV